MQSVTSRNVLWVVARLTSAYPRLESVFSLVRDFWVHPGLLASRLLAPGGPSRDLRASARWLLFRNGVPCGDSGQEIRPCALMMLGSGGIWRRVAKPWPVSAVRVPEVGTRRGGPLPKEGATRSGTPSTSQAEQGRCSPVPKNAHLLKIFTLRA